jgi:Family of unknown function (DUF6131)
MWRRAPACLEFR